MLYRAEDISLSEDFTSDVVNVALFNREESAVGNLERFGGLYDHGFCKYFKSPLNVIQVQPDIAKFFRPPCLAFVPAEETLRDIFEFYKSNAHCDMEERQIFDEVPHLQTSTYMIGVDSWFQKDLFTRHPLTGKILRHRHPYTTLPKFTLPVHPCIAALRAGSIVSFFSDVTPVSTTLLAIKKYHRSRRDIPPRRHPTKALSATSSASSSSSTKSMVSTASSSGPAITTESLDSSRASSQDTQRPKKRKLEMSVAAEPSRLAKVQRRVRGISVASTPTAIRAICSKAAKSGGRTSRHGQGLSVRCA